MTSSLLIEILKIDKFGDFSSEIDFKTKIDIFRDDISLIINQCHLHATEGSFPPAAQHKQAKRACIYVYIYIYIYIYLTPHLPQDHHNTICRKRCVICHAYDQIFNSSVQFPFEPCWHLRCTYLLHHPYVPDICYIGQTGATRHVIHQPRSNHRIWKHLQNCPSLRWQILKPIATEFQTPTRQDTTLERQALLKLKSLHPDINFITHDPKILYDAANAAEAPLSILED